MRFRPEQHVRSQSDFRRAREQGRRYQSDAFTFWWWQNPDSAVRRVGVVASTAAIGNAVQRNRAKRRLRELFRRHQEQLPAGGDLVIVARRALNRLPFAALEERFLAICRQLPAPSHV